MGTIKDRNGMDHMEKQWKQQETLFSWAAESLEMVTAAIKLKDACSLEVKLWPN